MKKLIPNLFDNGKSSYQSESFAENEWDSNYSPKPKQQTTTYSSTPRLKKLVEATKSQTISYQHDDVSNNLQIGMHIEHERFGIGEIINIEGNAANKKATIKFDTVGLKQLLLKFARLKIVDKN